MFNINRKYIDSNGGSFLRCLRWEHSTYQVIQSMTFLSPSWRSPTIIFKGSRELTTPKRSQRITRESENYVFNKWVHFKVPCQFSGVYFPENNGIMRILKFALQTFQYEYQSVYPARSGGTFTDGNLRIYPYSHPLVG